MTTASLRATIALLLVLACVACKRTPVAQPAKPKPFYPSVRLQSLDRGNGNPSEMIFGMRPVTADGPGPTEFRNLGETIPKTTIRLTDFDPGHRRARCHR